MATTTLLGDAASDRVDADPVIALGRKVYNFRCYYCHGYNGDAQTVAASFLDPRPRDFTKADGLDVPGVLDALKNGRPGTAMKTFAKTLSDEEMQAVASFVVGEFVEKRAINTYYHTPENGWGDHRERYEAAYPFVLGEISPTASPDSLTPAQRAGQALYQNTCITCHETDNTANEPVIFESKPLSDQGCGVMCHSDGSVVFPWTRGDQLPPNHQRPTSPYEAHGTPPKIDDLTEQQAAGERLFQKNCAFCHAMDGTGKNWIGAFLEPHARNLTDGQAVRHLYAPGKLEAVITQGLPQTSMPGWGRVMDGDSIAAIAAYVRRAFMPEPQDGVPATESTADRGSLPTIDKAGANAPLVWQRSP